MPPPTNSLTNLSIPRLRARLNGRVIGPDDASYDRARTVFYGGFDRRPAVIVRAAHAADAAYVVGLARDTGLDLSVRSGAHSPAGHGVNEGGIVLDVSALREMRIDTERRTAWAGTGLTAGEYTAAAAEHGLATGFGDTGSVGIGGITLAGGVGYLVRKYGLTIDNLLAAEVVTADGQLIRADEETNPDLFWGLRGGGGPYSRQVHRGPASRSQSVGAFQRLRTSPELEAERRQLDRWLALPPDKTLAMIAQLDDPTAMPESGEPVSYACPMHPEVTSDQPGRCPKCGMKLLAVKPASQPMADQPEATHHDHEMQHHMAAGHEDGHGPHGDPGDGIEWEDDMIEINRQTTTVNTHWRFLDRTDSGDSPLINWRFTVGQRVKIRLINEMESDHPMHHPFHLHGAGRFLVLTRDGTVEPNLVWKDTVLVCTGQMVDILFDVTNPGLWMAHCHIAEHMQSGVMFSFTVARSD
jgi:hypothetical protein